MSWNVSPVLLQLGPLQLRWYGLMFVIGFWVGFLVMRAIFRREGRDESALTSLLIHLVVGTLVGARLGQVLFYEPAKYLARPWEILFIWEGGLASHGGTVGVMVALWLFRRRHREFGYLWLADRLAIPVAFVACCIRVGNFFNSEILGRPTDLPWAIAFPLTGGPAPRHPAMLYEALSYLVLFGVLAWRYRRRGGTPPGFLVGLLLVWVFASRFLIEFVKEDQEAFEQGMVLNMGQLLSIPFVLVGLLAMTGKLAAWLPWLAEPTTAPAQEEELILSAGTPFAERVDPLTLRTSVVNPDALHALIAKELRAQRELTGEELGNSLRLSGTARRMLGDGAAAVADLTRALELTRVGVSTVMAQLRLAEAHRVAADGQADALFEACAAKVPGISGLQAAFIHQHLGKWRFDRGEFAKALAHFEKALEIRIAANTFRTPVGDEQVASSTLAVERARQMLGASSRS